MNPTYWAAYAGSAAGSEITLHRDRLSALQSVYLALDVGDGNEYKPMDEEELEDLIREHCEASADDWYVEEVAIP